MYSSLNKQKESNTDLWMIRWTLAAAYTDRVATGGSIKFLNWNLAQNYLDFMNI